VWAAQSWPGLKPIHSGPVCFWGEVGHDPDIATIASGRRAVIYDDGFDFSDVAIRAGALGAC
jgi:hypothetical protein